MNQHCLFSQSALLLTLLLAGATAPAAEEPAKIDAGKYEEVNLAMLRATPEEFKNKRVRATTHYLGFLTSFPEYMEKSGFKSGKYYLARILPRNLPAMTKKTDAMNDVIPVLEKGKVVTVYGRVKEFSIRSKGLAPQYYLDLEHLEVAENQDLALPAELRQELKEEGFGLPGEEPPEKKRPPRRPWR